ncbi:Syntaxin-7 [Fasciolopsis buskii]|uniref:Syntaxin-7 n=1 Tax=Fasciolopsis buskii TaxID=27845 RepID=A0A8E0S7E9_9TREM|nr:Syntaxin-7 [Fasciolopsis buski]
MKQVQLPPFQKEMDEQHAQEMEQLESDIVQVNELFTTLATYVHDQGAMVDSIGQNIEVAYEKVEAGTRQLDSAVKQCRSARRKKCICLVIVFAVLVVIAIILGVTLHK